MIDLYTAGTPNGQKVSIALEEMAMDYQVTPIDLSARVQKEDWFLEINPNGRIPAIIDRGEDGNSDENNEDFAVFESGAILIYLAEKSGKFLPSDVKGRSEVLQWLMFQMGGLGPMQGQAHVFYRYADEHIPYAINRYQKEVRRLYEVLDKQLSRSEYLAGDYSIADMATFPWARAHDWAGVPVEDLEHFNRWLSVIADRPAVLRGLAVPNTDVSAESSTEEKVSAVRNFLN